MSDALNDHPVLGQLVLGYAPMIDRHRAVSALQLTLYPLRGAPLPAADALVALLQQAWPESAGRLALMLAHEALLAELLQHPLPLHQMLAVPAFMAATPELAPLLQAQHRRGATLLLNGPPREALPRELLDCFAYSVIDLHDERRDGLPPAGGQARRIPHVQAGVHTLQAMDEAFSRGAIATLGWPLDARPPVDTPAGARSPVKPAVATMVELMRRVDRGDPIERLEDVVKTEPTLAYKLLKYINSPVFGLRVEVSSFGHALMLLGYQRLKRWLALLLVSGSVDLAHRPLAYAALRRALVLEQLGVQAGADESLRGELFICGVFSLLDQMLQQPFAQLLSSVPVSEPLRAALLHHEGPFAGYLRLVQALECANAYDIGEQSAALLLAPAQVNRALLSGLAAARQLE